MVLSYTKFLLPLGYFLLFVAYAAKCFVPAEHQAVGEAKANIEMTNDKRNEERRPEMKGILDYQTAFEAQDPETSKNSSDTQDLEI